MILFIVLVGALGVAAKVEGVEADATIYIRASGDVEGTDKILRDGNTYTFIDNINDSIVVQKSNIIIDGNGYTLKGSGSWGSPGFSLTNIINVTIKDANIDYFIFGIYLNSASQMTISRNNITNNSVGVYLSNSFVNTVSGNLVASGDYGVNIQSSGGNTVSGNNITNNAIYGVKLLKSSFNNTVAMNNITNNYYGVYMNTCSFNNTISRNNIIGNIGYGIVLYTSSKNDVYGNNLANNGYYGVYLGDSFDNMVFGNTIVASNCGIFLEYSYNNTISGNNITKNKLWGIRLHVSSNNKIYENDMTNNLYYAISVQSSSDNFIYNNNFVNNTHQVQCSSDSVNTWDDGYPSGGNYWSDYTGADFFSGPYQNETGSDGIGDTSFVINANNVDRYPLMIPYGTDSHTMCAHLVVRGSDNGIYYRIYNSTSGSWESWGAVNGATSDSPAAAEYAGNLHIVVRGMEGNSLWHGQINLTDNAFLGWTWLSGSTPSAPTLTSNGTALCLVVRGSDNTIYYRYYVGDSWGGWHAVPTGSTGDSPAAALLGNNLHIIVRGMDGNSLWHTIVGSDDTVLKSWTALSGSTPSRPALAASLNLNKLYLVVRGWDDMLGVYYNDYTASTDSWGSWTRLEGATCDGPSAVMLNSVLHVVVRGFDGNTLWQGHVDLPSNSFSGWTWISGATQSAPTFTG